MDNSAYKPVACLSANDSHVYVWVSESVCGVEDLKPYCGYLALIPFLVTYSVDLQQLRNASYADLTKLISKGFTVHFPVEASHIRSVSRTINICLNRTTR